MANGDGQEPCRVRSGIFSQRLRFVNDEVRRSFSVKFSFKLVPMDECQFCESELRQVTFLGKLVPVVVFRFV